MHNHDVPVKCKFGRIYHISAMLSKLILRSTTCCDFVWYQLWIYIRFGFRNASYIFLMCAKIRKEDLYDREEIIDVWNLGVFVCVCVRFIDMLSYFYSVFPLSRSLPVCLFFLVFLVHFLCLYLTHSCIKIMVLFVFLELTTSL